MSYIYRTPAEIEAESMRMIAAELKEMGISLSQENKAVIHRVIHTTADFDYVNTLRFSKEAEKRAESALKDAQILITDTNMALSGISKKALAQFDLPCACYMADAAIAARAKAEQSTRAAASMSYALEQYERVFFVVGNAPTALIRLCELIRAGYRPAYVVAAPVGFVNVCESKEEIFELCRAKDIPIIAAMGRKGGSNVAAAICNALLYQSLDLIDPKKRNF